MKILDSLDNWRHFLTYGLWFNRNRWSKLLLYKVIGFPCHFVLGRHLVAYAGYRYLLYNKKCIYYLRIVARPLFDVLILFYQWTFFLHRIECMWLNSIGIWFGWLVMMPFIFLLLSLSLSLLWWSAGLCYDCWCKGVLGWLIVGGA